MTRRVRIGLLALVALAAAAALCATGTLPRWLAGDDAPNADGGSRVADALDGATDLDAAARDEASRLRGFPGLSRARRGTGSVTGTRDALRGGRRREAARRDRRRGRGARRGAREVAAATTTADDGTFSLAPLPSLAGYVLRVRANGRKDLVVRGVAVSDGRATDVGHLVFGAPTALAGGAVDALGRPVAGAVVSIERDAARAGGMDMMRALRDIASAPGPVAEGRTDADGRFLVKGLPPGRYLVRVERPGYATAFVGGVAGLGRRRLPRREGGPRPGLGLRGARRRSGGPRARGRGARRGPAQEREPRPLRPARDEGAARTAAIASTRSWTG